MKLLIVESPAKARTIGHYLGKDFTVRASVGHVRDLPKSSKNAIDIEGGFIPHYVISPGKEAVIADLKQLAKKATEVILATDPDREGEAIAWHVAEAIGLKKPARIVFHEITKAAVEEALAHARSIDEKLRVAQEARRVLDRLFGYDLSALIWQKLRYGLSAGRVQSPALRILAERERQIAAFIPEKFWVIEAELKTAKGVSIPAHATVEPKTAEEAERLVEAAKRAKRWQIAAIEKSVMERSPRPPFTTSTLQQAASSRLGYSPSQTMRLAQKLYEAGLITYMRTDSVNLSAGAQSEIASQVTTNYGANYLTPRHFKTKSKNAQEAHEAIRPTKLGSKSAGTSLQEKKLYELIWARTVASQMATAELDKTALKIKCELSEAPELVANGMTVKFDGWLKADPRARGEETELPAVSQGDPLRLAKIESIGKETTPPNRYSEAGLVKELEKRGIGRPSTYAPIIKHLLDRGYVEKEQRALKVTETGEAVSAFLEEHFADYISDSFTSQMEDDLDEIAEGKKEYRKTLADFYKPFQAAIAGKKKLPKITNLGPAPDDMKCPTCQSEMIIKLGRAGKFYSCGRFPECTGARMMTGEVMGELKETGEICPECGGKLVERQGRFGKFTACANYPKCKFIKKDAAAEAAKSTGVGCPLCKIGMMTEKRGRFGIFYGCSNYPKCKNIIKTKPTGNICPTCGALMMEGTKTIPERCSNKSCKNHNPHKLDK